MVRDLGEDKNEEISETTVGKGLVRYFEAKDAVHEYLVFPWFETGRKCEVSPGITKGFEGTNEHRKSCG